MRKSRPLVLIVAAKWWPLSARLTLALLRHGCRVVALCPAGHPLNHVDGMDGVRHFDTLRPLESLRLAMLECHPDIVVPCDDGMVALLHALHANEPLLHDLIETSLGPSHSYSVVTSRYQLLTLAADLGIAVPRTERVSSAADIESWHERVSSAAVLKVDGESGGNGVRMSGSLDESLAAWAELKQPGTAATSWKRLAIDRDPLAHWTRQRAATPEITMQAFIRGGPANCMMACWQGKVLDSISVAVVAADGPTGAATVVRRIKDEQIAHGARRLAERLQLSGFYGLDFMLEEGTGTPYLIEMNPRSTQLGHLEFADQGSLAGVFSSVLGGGLPRPVVHQPIRVDRIAFWPQALTAIKERSQLMDGTHLDVPHDAPRLLKELELGPWPQRQWLARFYHSLRPLRQSSIVEFDAMPVSGRGSTQITTLADYRVREFSR